jgi:hypothetical protein
MSARRAMLTGLVTVSALGCLVACSGGSDNTAGGPIPHQLDGETYPGPRSQVTGTFDLASNGCMVIVSDGVRRLAVWPRGAAQSKDDATVVKLSDGTEVHPRDAITADATVFPVAQLTSYPDGYWGSQVTYCVPGDSDVLVLDTVAVTGG